MLQLRSQKKIFAMCPCRQRPYFHHRNNSSTTKQNFYSILGVHPKATQEQIKSAYYELSKVFHPDKNNSLQNQNKFREITEAYEVLGNYESRKKYDTHLLVPNVVFESPGSSNDFTSNTKLYKNFDIKPRYTGRTPIYNFDEFYRMHYGSTLQEDLYRKKQRESNVRRKRPQEDQPRVNLDFGDRLTIVFVTIFVVMSILIKQSNNYDTVPEKRNKE